MYFSVGGELRVRTICTPCVLTLHVAVASVRPVRSVDRWFRGPGPRPRLPSSRCHSGAIAVAGGRGRARFALRYSGPARGFGGPGEHSGARSCGERLLTIPAPPEAESGLLILRGREASGPPGHGGWVRAAARTGPPAPDLRHCCAAFGRTVPPSAGAAFWDEVLERALGSGTDAEWFFELLLRSKLLPTRVQRSKL